MAHHAHASRASGVLIERLDGCGQVLEARIFGAPGDGACLFDIDYDTQTVTAGETFFDNAGTPDLTRLDEKFVFEHETGTWLAFTEGSFVWRVVRLAPGCVYRSWRLLQEQT